MTLLNYTVMKKLLLGIATWMVATAVWAESGSPVTVNYTFSETAVTDARRIGDDCWVQRESVTQWGWKLSAVGRDATISAEGRTLRVPMQTLDGKVYLNATEASRQLGAIAEWQEDSYRILGEIRSLDFVGSSLRVNASMSFRLKMDVIPSPNRLAIDFYGVRLSPHGNFNFPPGVRVGMFKPGVFRLVIEDPRVTLPKTSRPGTMRWLDLSLAPFKFVEDRVVEPTFNNPIRTSQTNPPPLTPADQTTTNTGTSPIPAPVLPTSILQSSTVNGVSDREEVVRFDFSSLGGGTPAVSYETATTINLTFKSKITTGFDFVTLKGKLMTGAEMTTLPSGAAIIKVRTASPTVFEVSSSANAVVMRLKRPKNQDGSLIGKTIVIDPGHGGNDSGATSGNVYEKALTLSIGLKVAEKLTDAGVSVIMTRKSDVRIALTERADIANRSRATLFVSIHINSSAVNNKTSGGITFYHMKAPEGMLLAKCIQDQIAAVSKIPNLGTWSDSRIYASGFSVLRNTEMPAVLIELGFINHERDRGMMVKQDWQENIAEAIVKGIKVYLGNVKETANP